MDNDHFPEDVIARRSRDVLMRLLSTPPQPKPKTNDKAVPKKKGRPAKSKS